MVKFASTLEDMAFGVLWWKMVIFTKHEKKLGICPKITCCAYILETLYITLKHYEVKNEIRA